MSGISERPKHPVEREPDESPTRREVEGRDAEPNDEGSQSPDAGADPDESRDAGDGQGESPDAEDGQDRAPNADAGDGAGWPASLGAILRETAIEWLEDGVPARGAALAYYVLLSLGPLMVILVGVLEFFLTTEEVRSAVLTAVQTSLGGRAAQTASTVLEEAQVPDLLSFQAIFTIALLLFGATAAFTNVRGSLDAIWGVEPEVDSKKEIALDLLRARFRGFIMVVLTGAVVTFSFFVTSVTRVMAERLEAWMPFGSLWVQMTDAAVSMALIGLLFAAIYRTLPSVQIEWHTVWVGAFATALFFVVGKWLVALILARSSWTSYYGPGASVVTFLAWIYFSAQIFFLGAEFTQVWSRSRGGVMSGKH